VAKAGLRVDDGGCIERLGAAFLTNSRIRLHLANDSRGLLSSVTHTVLPFCIQDPANGWMAYAVGQIPSSAERITRLEMTWAVSNDPGASQVSLTQSCCVAAAVPTLRTSRN
jgi:hypothetical protein